MSKSLRPVAYSIVSTNHGMFLVNRFDYKLTENGGYGVGFQLLCTSAFDTTEVDLALHLLTQRRKFFGDGVVAVDCGANIGVHTVEWAKLMHGWGEVIAIEAQERIFYALAGNITMNNCFNARAIWAAVGASNGTIRVPMPNYLTPSSFGSLEIMQREQTENIGQDISYAEEHTVETRLLALDDLGLQRLDFLKIDVEGMEIAALNGAERLLASQRPILIIEKIKSDEGSLVGRLDQLGYKLFNIGINLLCIHATDATLEQFQNL